MLKLIPTSILVLLFLTGCITTSGKNLSPISPPKPQTKAIMEDTVGDFAFTLEGGKLITSNKAGRILNEEILKVWVEKGYIESHSYVPTSQFSGKADYELTLSGSQYGDSSITMQILSGLTLFLIPHSVDTKFDAQYTVKNTKTGEQYSASVEESYDTMIELFLIFALPISSDGMDETMTNMADHLYQQLYEQGAFRN